MNQLAEAATILAVATLLTLSACQPEKPRPAQSTPPAPVLPAPIDNPAVQAERPVIDSEVRRHWRAVEFVVRDRKQEGKARTLQVVLGEEARAPGTSLTIKVLAFVPDFAMGTDSITSKSMRDVNPAAKIQIVESGKELFKGWAFRDFPEMHSFEDPRYTIKMTRAIAAGG